MSTDFHLRFSTNFGDAADITARAETTIIIIMMPAVYSLRYRSAIDRRICLYVGYFDVHTARVGCRGPWVFSYAKQLGKTFEPDEFRDRCSALVNDIDGYLRYQNL